MSAADPPPAPAVEPGSRPAAARARAAGGHRPRGGFSARGGLSSARGGLDARGGLSARGGRALLAVAIAGPALAVGGVAPELVAPWLGLVALLLVQVGCEAPARWPVLAWIGVVLLAATALQCVPLPAGARAWLAPGLHGPAPTAGTDAPWALAARGPGPAEGWVTWARALHDAGEGWPSLSPVPADTALELTRLAGLLALLLVAQRLPWRTSARAVAGLGIAISAITIAHAATGATWIYGLYAPLDVDLSGVAFETGPFVNPNHQASALLLGIACCAALAVDARRQLDRARSPAQSRTYEHRALLWVAGLTVQVPVLVLGLSRGGILVMLALLPALAVTAASGRGWSPSAPRQGHRSAIAAPLALGAALLLIAMVVLRPRAWRELATLWAADAGPLTTKLPLVRDALELLPRSPLLGLGRGAHADLFPTVDTSGVPHLVTHLESLPAAMVLEWGPFIGGGAYVAGLVALAARWPARRRSDDRRALAMIGLGLAALVVHNTFDFALEFLGVAAPAVALAGALHGTMPTPGAGRAAADAAAASGRVPLPVAVPRWLGGAALVGLAALAFGLAPHTWARRATRERELAALVADADAAPRATALTRAKAQALAVRPLDPTVHLLLARAGGRSPASPGTTHHATVAAALRPDALEPALWLAAAADAEGDRARARAAWTWALARTRRAPPADVVDHVLARFPAAPAFAAIAPRDPPAWQPWAKALRTRAPAHAEALVLARLDRDPDDGDARYLAGQLAIERGNPALGLHHARLLERLEPIEARGLVLMARALRAFDPPRHGEIVAQLTAALARDAAGGAGEAWDGTTRGVLEEELARAALASGDPAALTAVAPWLSALLRRPAERAVMLRRRALVEQIRAELAAAAAAPE